MPWGNPLSSLYAESMQVCEYHNKLNTNQIEHMYDTFSGWPSEGLVWLKTTGGAAYYVGRLVVIQSVNSTAPWPTSVAHVIACAI